MAVSHFHAPPPPLCRTPSEIEEQGLYWTADGYAAYAATETYLVIYGHPKRSVLLMSKGHLKSKQLAETFPLRPFASGEEVVLRKD
jgi:hypothetical protein